MCLPGDGTIFQEAGQLLAGGACVTARPKKTPFQNFSQTLREQISMLMIKGIDVSVLEGQFINKQSKSRTLKLPPDTLVWSGCEEIQSKFFEGRWPALQKCSSQSETEPRNTVVIDNSNYLCLRGLRMSKPKHLY